MNKKNTEYLYTNYSELFKNRDNLKQSLMGFGFECSDGWFSLVKNLCEDISQYFITKHGGIPEDFSVLQVKEKFGGLRFYISGAPAEVHDIIRDAELESYYICEHCGKVCPKYVKGGEYVSFHRDDLPWVLTLCDSCLALHLKERKLSFKSYVSDWQMRNKAPYKVMDVK